MKILNCDKSQTLNFLYNVTPFLSPPSKLFKLIKILLFLAGRSLWISGLSSKTRATDLKQLLSKYGKVVGAKVVTNARALSTCCYGYVVMATVADADNCIKYSHRTELHGRFICIDKVRSDRADSDKRKDSSINRRAAENKLRNRVSIKPKRIFFKFPFLNFQTS